MANKCAMNWASQVREISTKQGDIFTTIKLITQAIPVWRKQGKWESHKEPRRLARSITQLVMLPNKAKGVQSNPHLGIAHQKILHIQKEKTYRTTCIMLSFSLKIDSKSRNDLAVQIKRPQSQNRKICRSEN